jgi:hypothetical protein
MNIIELYIHLKEIVTEINHQRSAQKLSNKKKMCLVISLPVLYEAPLEQTKLWFSLLFTENTSKHIKKLCRLKDIILEEKIEHPFYLKELQCEFRDIIRT